MRLVPVEKPVITAAALKTPQLAALWPVPVYAHFHYFCEGNGLKTFSLSKEDAYRGWLDAHRNPWWRRMLGASEFTIPMVEEQDTPHKVEYTSTSIVDLPK